MAAFDSGLFAVPEHRAALGTSSTQTVWRLPVILVSFAGTPVTHSASGFDTALFDSTGATATGSVYDYYQWASGGRIRVVGKVVASVTLPGDRAYYASQSWGLSTTSTPNNMYGMVRDALTQCWQNVDWSLYDVDHDGYVDMLWVVHAGIGGEASVDRNNIWSITSRMSGGWRNGASFVTGQLIPGTTNQYYRLDRFSTLPELSGFHPGARSEIGVFCHEFGHALGLPDLYDTSNLSAATNAGPGNWSLMSTGAYGGNGISPQYPSHLGGWASLFLGWRSAIRPTQDTTLVLPPLTSGGPVVEFFFQGESYPEHFLLENRRRESFDRSLPNDGLIVTHLDEAGIGARLAGNKINAGPTPGMWLLEADGDYDIVTGLNRGDTRDPFPGALGRTAVDDVTHPSLRTFAGAVTNMGLRDIQIAGRDVQVHLQVRAPAWHPSEDHTIGSFVPTGFPSPARRGVIEPDGSIDLVRSEVRAARPQIVLRSRRGTVWESPLQISASTEAALDPALALLPGGHLAVVWSDTRGGRARVLYRSRINGVWGGEQVVGDLPGDNRAPVIACDDHGRVQIAWLNVQSDASRVYFARFLYFAPFAQPVAITGPGEMPGRPALAVTREGTGYLIWPDAASPPQHYMFCRFQPDSGLSQHLPWTPASANPQTAISVLVDDAGTVHTLWQVNGAGLSELHYQRRLKTAKPSPRDTLLESRGAPISDPTLAAEPGGSLHMAFEAANPLGQQVLYKRWRTGFGWDFRSTEVSTPQDGSASDPILLPFTAGNVSVFFVAYPDLSARFIERDRMLDGADPLVVDPVEGGPRAALAIGPNPLRSGRGLELRFSEGPLAPEDAVVDFFDLAGRRMAAVPLEGAGGVWRGRLGPETTAGWATGVYFAKLRGGRAAVARLVLLR